MSKDITRHIEALIEFGLTIADIEEQAQVTITATSATTWAVDSTPALGSILSLKARTVNVAAIAAAKQAEAAKATKPARVSNARAARYSSQYDPAGYGEVMGARVAHRDNRAGFTTYDGNTQIWD